VPGSGFPRLYETRVGRVVAHYRVVAWRGERGTAVLTSVRLPSGARVWGEEAREVAAELGVPTALAIEVRERVTTGKEKKA